MSYQAGPFSHEHGYLQWGGVLPGNEIWSCGLRVGALDNALGGAFDYSGEAVEVLLTHYVTAITAFHQRVLSMISSRAKLDFVKLNKIGVDGHYADQGNSHVRFLNPKISGGGPATAPPNQVALALTLTTDVQRGPANKGRIYIPLPTCTVMDDGLITDSEANVIMHSFRTLLEDISDTPGIDSDSSPDVLVMSRKAGAPAARYVTGVRVGRVLDTQRRRRNALKENYVSEVVDFGAA